ncbi:FitA-like ribbon-helix-helix domain-containing protein [Azospirillum sp. sgz301742]
MGHLTLNIRDDELIGRLKSRAAAHGRTLEEEHQEILREVLQTPVQPPASGPDFWELAAQRRERLRGRTFPDTTQMIRDDRDRRAGLIPDEPE